MEEEQNLGSNVWYNLIGKITSTVNPANIRLDEDVFCLHPQKASSRRLDQDEYLRPRNTSSEDVFKTSSRRLDQDQYTCLSHTSSRHLQDVLKTSSQCLQDVLPRRLQYIFKTSCKNVFKTSSRHLQDVFKTSSRRHVKMSSRRFQDLSSIWTVLVNTSSRRIQYVSETYCKEGYLQKDLPRSHFWEIFGQCTKFARVIEISQVLVFHSTTPFSVCLQRRI